MSTSYQGIPALALKSCCPVMLSCSVVTKLVLRAVSYRTLVPVWDVRVGLILWDSRGQLIMASFTVLESHADSLTDCVIKDANHLDAVNLNRRPNVGRNFQSCITGHSISLGQWIGNYYVLSISYLFFHSLEWSTIKLKVCGPMVQEYEEILTQA